MAKILSAIEIKEKLLPVFSALPVDRAILFGSYAKGQAQAASDVDILIDSGGKIRGIDFFGVLSDISESLKIPVDLIEASQLIEGGRIQREIAASGVVIYERA